MASKPLFPLSSFNPAPGITHLCAAGESLPLQAHNAAFTKYISHKASGHKGRVQQAQYIEDTRALIAEAWRVRPKEVGFAPSVADGVSMLVESLDWTEGDNVCVHADEFPSIVAPFALRRQQQEIQLKKNGGDGEITSPEVRYYTNNNSSLKDVVNSKTRLIAVSYVSYLDGSRIDLQSYRALADSVGAILVIDYTQAAGYMPINASIADFAFSACYKWLLGTTGAAIAYWNQGRRPDWRPVTGGWHSLGLGSVRPAWETSRLEARGDALCFSRGNPAHLAVYVLRECLEFLGRWGAREIQDHVQGLTAALLGRLRAEGIVSATPVERERHGASVVVYCEGASDIVDEMARKGVYVWNGQGRVRISFHGYNCLGDVDRIMEVFPALWRKFNGNKAKL
ncbi:hypothetical protein ASPVEDRAFT_25746 [Aspergillus versicolor CBS 583.65]|uniref:Aminotransferase class V domain-containing protein n=1 Tax=Aspergillus versicolor CBS 583.65 TaxID=1036611 RepID=A0A1L9PBQ2_ASPVE|nr:uncharacterized protein ASPVEDRAFT_25746 [Aspergillus versicolor CBS 583.65]OJI98902.1 hypothetical protein ASPVEDRAFT_25746 [Aspergillus versicolor CBS 583.65]